MNILKEVLMERDEMTSEKAELTELGELEEASNICKD